jgi:hypothetical protein
MALSEKVQDLEKVSQSVNPTPEFLATQKLHETSQ